jgi:4-oxalocrotonate tautomerase
VSATRAGSVEVVDLEGEMVRHPSLGSGARIRLSRSPGRVRVGEQVQFGAAEAEPRSVEREVRRARHLLEAERLCVEAARRVQIRHDEPDVLDAHRHARTVTSPPRRRRRDAAAFVGARLASPSGVAGKARAVDRMHPAPSAVGSASRREERGMPVIEVKLYDRRVTEESVPKMIEALTNALHESSGAAIEHIQVIIQGVPPQHWGQGGKPSA